MIDTLKGLALSRISSDDYVPRIPAGAVPLAGLAHPRAHDFHWQDNKWICCVCLMCSKSLSSVSRSNRKCFGVSPFASFLGDQKGHTLWIARFGNDQQSQILYCSVCWSYTTTRLNKSKLCKQCCGPPTVFRPSVRHYLLRCKPPVSKLRFSKPFRLV